MKTLLLILLVLVLQSCATSDSKLSPDVTATGARLLQPFKKNLQQALKSGLAEGPENAVDVCHIRAPEIAARYSTAGVRLGRSSHKLRNAGNTAPDWAQPILDSWVSEASLRQAAAVPLDNNRYGYIEPIMLQPLCETCHGQSLSPGLAASIADKYPDDKAVGFKTGDLRGVFWVEFPATLSERDVAAN